MPKGEKSAPIHKAIHKYGIENFEFSIVEECDKSLLDDRECYWIRFYDSYNNGYNATIGGNQNRDHLNKKVFVTINTVLQDCELDDLLKNLDVCCRANIDAVILQDLGVANIIKKYYGYGFL